MKYIDTDHLRKEVKRLEKAAHKSALGCADSETRKFHEGKDFAYQHIGFLIDSLQQEQPSLPDNLDEAELKYVESLDNPPANQEEERIIYQTFKAGAEWMTKQIK